MITVQEILNAAYGKSRKNDPGKIANEAAELLGVATRAVRAYFSIGARLNPGFFAESTTVTASSETWARPAAAESIFRIQLPDATEVVVVPMDDQAAEPTRPAVYRWGQVYRSAGNTNDPTTETLEFFYSKRPDDPADLTSEIDALWVESYNELLFHEVAIYLALKDGRSEEVQGLASARDSWLQLFVSFLEHETMTEVRRFKRSFSAPSATPISSLLQGPTGVEL